ncbi:hypothetical protein [Caldimonas sp. KR1-144]
MLNTLIVVARGAGAIYKSLNFTIGAVVIAHGAWKWYQKNRYIDKPPK